MVEVSLIVGTADARLFDSTTSLPIRQGRLFPDSPPNSKKFGRSLGTMKVRRLSSLAANWQYRFDLAPVYVSHVYQQVSQELWAAGKSQSLGVKARFGRFRADAHQRAQEKTVRHEKLRRTTVVVHKPFYAADLLLDGIQLKGIRADFLETALSARSGNEGSLPKASELSREDIVWFNFFDYIDVDRKPLDQNPQVEIVDVGDCPQIFYSKRVKARQTMASDDDNSSLGSGSDSRAELESSKFGHEKSHICYLGAASGVGPTQLRITQDRVSELEARLTGTAGQVDDSMKVSPDSLLHLFCADTSQTEQKAIMGSLRTLNRHLDELSSRERRHIDDDTFQAVDTKHSVAQNNRQGEMTFENTFHVHCPRVYFNNASRNVGD